MGYVKYWTGLHVDLHPTHTAFAGRRGQHKRVATLPTPSWLRRKARQSGKEDRQGGVAGQMGLRAGLWSRVAGRVGWRAGKGAGRVVGGGWIFGVKNVLE